MTMPISLTKTEKRNGLIFLAVNLFLLPGLTGLVRDLFSLDTAQANIFYNAVNFICIGWIFRRFLQGNARVALVRVFPVIWYAILGYLGFRTLGDLLSILTYSLFPEFVNLNDTAVALMVQRNPLFALSIILLVPVTEEALYRGLIFRGLYDKNPTLAYLTSVFLFAAIHVSGYIGTLSPLHLLLSLIQYLPAGYCLCFAYRRSGSILSPIFIHMAINAVAVSAFMR